MLVLSEEESVFDPQSGQTKTKLLVYAALAQSEALCQHVDYHTCIDKIVVLDNLTIRLPHIHSISKQHQTFDEFTFSRNVCTLVYSCHFSLVSLCPLNRWIVLE